MYKIENSYSQLFIIKQEKQKSKQSAWQFIFNADALILHSFITCEFLKALQN